RRRRRAAQAVAVGASSTRAARRSTAGGRLPRSEIVGDVALLEVVLPAIRDGELVAHRVAQAAALPAHAGPLGPDGSVDGVGAGGPGPVDGGVEAEVVEPPDPVGRDGFVGGGKAQDAVLPAHAGPLVQDGAVDGVGAGGPGPVDGAVVGEVVEPSDPVRRRALVGGGKAEDAALSPHARALVADGPADRLGPDDR